MLFSQIYQQHLYDEKHLWMISGPREEWKHDKTPVRCTHKQLNEAAKSIIWFTWESVSEEKKPTISGQVLK